MKKYFTKQCFKMAFFLIVVLNGKVYCQNDTLKYPPNSLNVIPVLNVKDTDIRDVLRGIALEYQTNIVVDNRINSRISAALFKISVIDAIQIIAEDNGFNFYYDSQRFYVTTPPEITQPKPIEPEPLISYNEGENKIDIELHDVDIQKFVKKLREETQKNFLITNGTTGRLKGSLRSVDFEVGLRNILQNNGFNFLDKDSIYYISKSSYFSSEWERIR